MPGSGDRLAAARAAVAVGDWAAALQALPELPADEPDPEHLELLAAASYGTGDFEATVTAWEEAHALHRQRGETLEAARAAAMVALYLMMDTGLMAPVRGWLQRAERLLAEQPETPVHALLAMLHAYEALMSGDVALVATWAERAMTLGDRHEVVPAATLGRVAAARVRIFTEDVAGGIAMLDEVAVMLMSGEVDPLTTGMVYCELICAMQGLGEYDRADEWTRAMDALRGRGDFFGGINGRCRVHRAEMLRLRGRCAEAEDEALHACEELRPWMRREFGWPLTELGTIRLRRGDLAGAEEAFRAAHANGWEPQPGLAQLRLAQGDAALAASLIREALERPLQIPWKERPPIGGLTRAPLLEARVPIAIAAGDVAAAAEAAGELAALARTYGSAALGAGADLAQAQVDLAAGRTDAAVEASRAARDAWNAIGVPFEAATARLVLAAALRAAGDDDLARHEESVAGRAFEDMGAVPLPARTPAAPTSGERGGQPRSGDGASAEAARGVFRAEGDTRRVDFAGQAAALRDLKGMRYLERLLAEPGREFHALDLVAVEAGTLPTGAPTAATGHLDAAGDAGPLLDEQARRAYRRRLGEIDQDIDEAEALGDPERAARARVERDFIVAELSRAFGLGGRARRAGSTAERARVSVTRAVRYALARIGERHPPLAEHLEHSVRTGTYCTYAPDPRAPVAWTTSVPPRA